MREFIEVISLIIGLAASYMLGKIDKEIECNIKMEKIEKKTQINCIEKINKHKDKMSKQMDICYLYDEGYINGLGYAIKILSKY